MNTDLFKVLPTMSSSAERSVAKDLVDIHLFPMLCVTEILPPYGRLDDKM